ncbi:glutathione S-transferase [Sinobacterium caligoides]|uniref:Glutathione S-transferase n=1 Tax=Sinobacterium caligoides TaxID=933926 RepID=A0A3N2DPT4_9GAMM|nr:glutathione S-transferase [Sinobacterium caligoides]ROS01838.1 glutathione S-transferase [Sinobacterium caligoides]
MPQLPILYSFRRCPYAMRARLAIIYSFSYLQRPLELREVVLKHKPPALLAASPKATVPVLVDANQAVVAESIDIMHWALRQADPDNWLRSDNDEQQRDIQRLINHNDHEFKYWLDRYKYADRHPEHEASYYRQQAELFIASLEQRLQQSRFLIDDQASLADTAIMPFIRQFAHVDRCWFDRQPYPQLQHWLSNWLDSPLFTAIMKKYPAWQEGDAITPFPVAAAD